VHLGESLVDDSATVVHWWSVNTTPTNSTIAMLKYLHCD